MSSSLVSQVSSLNRQSGCFPRTCFGDAVTHELKIGASEYIIIASGKGHVVQLRVPGQELVLSALFDNDATVGHALAVARTFAQKMAELLA